MSHTSENEFRSRPSSEGGAESVRHSAQEVAESAREAGARVAGTARAEAGSAVESGRELIASRLDNIVAALHASADELQHRDDRLSEGVVMLADQVRSAARHLHEQDLQGLSRELSSFARHYPGIFLGGAAVLGFAVSRLATAPEPQGRGYRPGKPTEGGRP
ncbi:MAG: hypothetical protein ACLFWF_11655 [Alphaproteobacteria bacterium]